MDEIVKSREQQQLLMILVWCIALIAFFEFTDFGKIQSDIIDPPAMYRYTIPLENVFNRTQLIKDNFYNSHYLFISKSDSNLIIMENKNQAITVSKNNNDIFDSLIIMKYPQLNASISTSINSIKMNLIHTPRFINLLKTHRTIFDNMLFLTISWLKPILWGLVVLLGLFFFALYLYSRTLSQGFLLKTYNFMPHIVITNIVLLGILQSITISKLGGLLFCPLGTTLSSIIPVLYYQAYNSSRNWKETSRIRKKFLYWLPFYSYLLGHIVAEVIYRCTTDRATNAFYQNHFNVSYYSILIIAIALGIWSIYKTIKVSEVNSADSLREQPELHHN